MRRRRLRNTHGERVMNRTFAVLLYVRPTDACGAVRRLPATVILSLSTLRSSGRMPPAGSDRRRQPARCSCSSGAARGRWPAARAAAGR